MEDINTVFTILCESGENVKKIENVPLNQLKMLENLYPMFADVIPVGSNNVEIPIPYEHAYECAEYLFRWIDWHSKNPDHTLKLDLEINDVDERLTKLRHDIFNNPIHEWDIELFKEILNANPELICKILLFTNYCGVFCLKITLAKYVADYIKKNSSTKEDSEKLMWSLGIDPHAMDSVSEVEEDVQSKSISSGTNPNDTIADINMESVGNNSIAGEMMEID